MMNNVIGMHIRMGGHKNYQHEMADKDDNWTYRETQLMHMYRETSHIDYFINFINYHLHINPKQKFYISTDYENNYNKLIEIYGSDIIIYHKRQKF